MSRKEIAGKKKAENDKTKVYLPADKGKIMVAMDKFEDIGGDNSYIHKMKDVLKDIKAKESIRGNKPWDITNMVIREGEGIISEIMEKCELNQVEANNISPKNTHAPILTGRPKIHKANIQIRGVVSMTGSPYEKLSKSLIPILRCIQGRSGM